AQAPNAAPTLAATAPTGAAAGEPEQLVQRLLPSADAAEPSSAAPAKAKRSAAKKRSKASARRASKRRARAAND
ncbi:MAG TPA: hypothetical protein VMG12_35535, partial [Polyangiaceae bacterium]|nr:hypothetical protein [Polyangiaceae bacterium]